ncbi:MAG: hypothetical protein GY931_09445, partial [Maribacter sp.]|nr:hypothetical protein [Maribacter sp.]
GTFKWQFPVELPLLVNQRWTICLKRSSITDRVANVKKTEDFSFTIIVGSKSFSTNLADHVGYIASARHLVVVLSRLILNDFDKLVYFQLIANDVLIATVGENCKLFLGNKISYALGLERSASVLGPMVSLFFEGNYLNDGLYDMSVLNKNVIYVMVDLVRSSIFGNKQILIVGTIDKNQNSDPPAYDLTQSPINSVKIQFLDFEGDMIKFCPISDNDFLFAVDFQFKRALVM